MFRKSGSFASAADSDELPATLDQIKWQRGEDESQRNQTEVAVADPNGLSKIEPRRIPVSYPHSHDEYWPVELKGVTFDSFPLRVVFERDRTGFEESKDLPTQNNRVIAGRYHVISYLGSAAFSKAVKCYDMETKQCVCMKVIKNDKDFLDQSLDEIKLL